MIGSSVQLLAGYCPIHGVGIVDTSVSVYLPGGKQRRHTENNKEEQKTLVEFDEVARLEECGVAFGGVFLQGPDLEEEEGCLQSGLSVYTPHSMGGREKLHLRSTDRVTQSLPY
jgi:hypothetical protein